MGKADTVTKAYMRENTVFADAFNFLIYGGRKVIEPKNLKELDTTEIAMPFGDAAAESAVQKYRDILKSAAFLNDNADEWIEVNAARVIKTITRTPIEIPEGAEVINMCEAIEAMMKDSKAIGRAEGKAEGKTEGVMEGTIKTLVGLVKDGLLSVKDAAARLDMTESSFEAVMKKMS